MNARPKVDCDKLGDLFVEGHVLATDMVMECCRNTGDALRPALLMNRTLFHGLGLTVGIAIAGREPLSHFLER